MRTSTVIHILVTSKLELRSIDRVPLSFNFLVLPLPPMDKKPKNGKTSQEYVTLEATL